MVWYCSPSSPYPYMDISKLRSFDKLEVPKCSSGGIGIEGVLWTGFKIHPAEALRYRAKTNIIGENKVTKVCSLLIKRVRVGDGCKLEIRTYYVLSTQPTAAIPYKQLCDDGNTFPNENKEINCKLLLMTLFRSRLCTHVENNIYIHEGPRSIFINFSEP